MLSWGTVMDHSNFTATLASYWSGAELQTNIIVFFNLLGALLLGSLVGYERAYHGRAAGMRTYGLVCMASAGLTVVAGFPAQWFGGMHATAAVADPTRVIQGIVTGIGFLGAGVIVKEGLNISGLTTAASIWAAACIGVLIGVGFYAASILLAVLAAGTMMWGARIEGWLPSHPAVGLTLKFDPGTAPDVDTLDRFVRDLGYSVARGTLALAGDATHTECRCVITVTDRRDTAALDVLSRALQGLPGLRSHAVGHVRN